MHVIGLRVKRKSVVFLFDAPITRNTMHPALTAFAWRGGRPIESKGSLCMRQTRTRGVLVVVLGLILGLGLDLPASAEPPPGPRLLDPTLMVGGANQVYTLPGSAYYVSQEQLRDHNYFSVNRMLARVPGVYVREEDGFGNFPNISIRGGDGTRSEKVTVMEDGILAAPAPYSAPSAYYSPNAGRMSGIEVLKGSSQVKYGPHTTGGAVNYLSTPIPEERDIHLRTTYGEEGTALGHAHYGNTLSGEFGRFGYLLELYHKQSDGYRTIDPGVGFAGSDDTGFSMTEPMVKLSWEPESALPQRLEFKYGYSDLDADETYTGLTEEDIRRDPSRRYAGTFLDRIQTEQHRTYLKYRLEPRSGVRLSTTAYYNEFTRNWYKIRQAGGQSLHEILARPDAFGDALGVLQMRAPGELGIRANNRSYKAYGLQFDGSVDYATGDLEHETRFGVRLHSDEIRRFQRDDIIHVGVGEPTVVEGEPGSGGNRHQEADAVAVWVEHEVTTGPLTLTPGVRVETIDMTYTDFESNSRNLKTGGGSDDTSEAAPGIGANLQLTDNQALFAGVYKGLSAPSPRSFIKDDVDWEESIGYELGLRHQDRKFYGEIAGFYTDFDNLIGTAAGLGLDGLANANAGEAEVYGLELLATYDPYAGETISLPLFLSATWTQAELRNALDSGGGENILAGGEPGADLPYVPEWKLAAGIGLDSERWGLDLIATYSGDTHGTVKQLNEPDDSSRQGKIEGDVIVDIAGHYRLRDGIRLMAGVNNLFDEQSITSRIPEGPRASAPRMAYIGLELF